MSDALRDELLKLNQRLLESIVAGDWATYQELCDPTITAIEPESHGLAVEGLPFHKFYFDLGGFSRRVQTTTQAPHVRIMGDVAVLSYVRLVQKVGAEGTAATTAAAETRVWQKRDGQWRHVHFHRTPLDR